MIRSIVDIESAVWSVVITVCPVSAAVIANAIVSKSLISPTRITSGSCLSTYLRAAAKEWVSLPISLWVTLVNEFNRVLDCNNVTGIICIAVI